MDCPRILYFASLDSHNPWIVVQSTDPWFAQRNPWIAQIHTLRPTYILVVCSDPVGPPYMYNEENGVNVQRANVTDSLRIKDCVENN